MDNTVLPYQDESDSSENDIDESSSDDEHSHLLSNNIGVLYNKFNTKDTKFLNMESAEEYQLKRNELFTPPIMKRIFTVKLNALSTTFSLQDDIKLPTTNIIGFKIMKSNRKIMKSNGFSSQGRLVAVVEAVALVRHLRVLARALHPRVNFHRKIMKTRRFSSNTHEKS